MVTEARMNLVTTLIGFGISAIFIAYIFVRVFCGRTPSGLRASPNTILSYSPEPGGEFIRPPATLYHLPPSPERATNRGLEPIIVAAFPTAKYNREPCNRGDAQSSCSICLAEYKEEEVLRTMPACGHEFHLVCIDMWLKKQSTCPICRMCLRHPTIPKVPPPPLLPSSMAIHGMPSRT